MHAKPATSAHQTILHETRFRSAAAGWNAPSASDAEWERTPDGLLLSAPGDGKVSVSGPGIHTRNGDTIALRGGSWYGFRRLARVCYLHPGHFYDLIGFRVVVAPV